MKVVAVIQARMGSTRLPGKILMDLCGAPMLQHVVERVRAASTIAEVIVATTDLPEDDATEAWCRSAGVTCFRGSENDVLDRFYQAVQPTDAGAVARFTADCPLLDPAIIDLIIGQFLERQPDCDYAVTHRYPRGLDTEVFKRSALEQAWRDDADPAWREHVTVYLYNHPELFGLHYHEHEVDCSGQRWTVDTLEDLEFVRTLIGFLQTEQSGRRGSTALPSDATKITYDWHKVLHAISEHPEWAALNQGVQQKGVPKDVTGA